MTSSSRRAGLIGFRKSFGSRALVESFRSDLISAARRGEAFRTDDGEPASVARVAREVDWFTFVREYADMKWMNAAATYRRTISEALTAVTPVMLKDGPGKPDPAKIRSVLGRWAFNKHKRETEGPRGEDASVLRWIERNALPLSTVMRPKTAIALHTAAVSKIDGKPLARSVARQRRMVLNNALGHAVALQLIPENPVKNVKWTAPKPSRAIDRRRVANAVQARSLLRAVADVQRSGPRLVGCFSAMYFAALRPEESVNLQEDLLTLPEPEWDEDQREWAYGWGDIYVEEATPHAGKAWTDTGQARDRRSRKRRSLRSPA